MYQLMPLDRWYGVTRTERAFPRMDSSSGGGLDLDLPGGDALRPRELAMHQPLTDDALG